MPDDLLMLRNRFFDLAVEHWFGYLTTEPGYAGDMGATEIWLIDKSEDQAGRLSSKVNLPFEIPPRVRSWSSACTLYTTALSRLIFGHAIPHHIYADDSQLYVSFASSDSAAALNSLQFTPAPKCRIDSGVLEMVFISKVVLFLRWSYFLWGSDACESIIWDWRGYYEDSLYSEVVLRWVSAVLIY